MQKKVFITRWFPGLLFMAFVAAAAPVFGNMLHSGSQDKVITGNYLLLLLDDHVPPLSPPVWYSNLNDTGIEMCADGSSNDLTCPAEGYPGQDGDYGRDALARAGQLNKVGGGVAGFDFTKIDANGDVLSPDASSWHCVHDNHTGLIWEIKSDDADDFRFMNYTYTWYSDDNNSNGGNEGNEGDTDTCNNTLNESDCNTQNYVQAVNEYELCGASDWRLPSRKELISIANNGHHPLALDTDYFPESGSEMVSLWTSTTNAQYSAFAWKVEFYSFLVNTSNKGTTLSVRLVRGGQ